MSFFPICLYKKAYKFGFLNIIFSRKKKKKKKDYIFLAYPTWFSVNPTGARKCGLTWGV